MPKIIDKPNLPKEIFAQETSPKILAQAVRVHLANQRQGTQNAKTRAEISRTRKKLYKQKGTGGARHGDRKAPIFVGGGVAFAPKPRDHRLKMPAKMNRQAIFGALSLKAKDKNVFVVSGFTSLTGKTKEIGDLLLSLNADAKKNFQKLLIITDGSANKVNQAGNNLAGVTIRPGNLINAYEILNADKVLIMEEAIGSLSGQSKSKTEIKSKALKSPKLNKTAVTKVKPAVKKTLKKSVNKSKS